jgi:hypothetical protein
VDCGFWIAKYRLKQAEASKILIVSRPRVYDVAKNGQVHHRYAPKNAAPYRQDSQAGNQLTSGCLVIGEYDDIRMRSSFLIKVLRVER